MMASLINELGNSDLAQIASLLEAEDQKLS